MTYAFRDYRVVLGRETAAIYAIHYNDAEEIVGWEVDNHPRLIAETSEELLREALMVRAAFDKPALTYEQVLAAVRKANAPEWKAAPGECEECGSTFPADCGCADA